ncbi:MAG: type I restriction enzyme HsdR N-terminal domain-containing protein [Alistipes sp.]|nr:type I restriction enzyme HsdR N-terminal domain-containing protein [Alistipes sp.]
MISTPKLNFPAIKLRAKEEDGHTLVFDGVRQIYIVLTPEEWVRRHLVEFLISHCKVAITNIIEEYPINLNSMAQRADVVVMGRDAQPLLLAECKAADINIEDEKIFYQATRYNAILGAKYILLTNGLKHLCYQKSAEGYVRCQRLPILGE